MPTYEYECENKHRFERFQSMKDEPVKVCPECGTPVHRVLHPAGIIFKGSGWYITDSRKGGGSDSKAESKSGKSDGKNEGKSESGESKSDNKSEPKTESKGESKSDAKSESSSSKSESSGGKSDSGSSSKTGSGSE